MNLIFSPLKLNILKLNVLLAKLAKKVGRLGDTLGKLLAKFHLVHVQNLINAKKFLFSKNF